MWELYDRVVECQSNSRFSVAMQQSFDQYFGTMLLWQSVLQNIGHDRVLTAIWVAKEQCVIQNILLYPLLQSVGKNTEFCVVECWFESRSRSFQGSLGRTLEPTWQNVVWKIRHIFLCGRLLVNVQGIFGYVIEYWSKYRSYVALWKNVVWNLGSIDSRQCWQNCKAHAAM